MNKNSKLVAALLAGSLFISNTGIVFAQGYTPQYNQKTYTTTPGANYSLQNGYSSGLQPAPAYTQPVKSNYLPPLQGRVVTVPMGAQIPAVTSSDITTEYLTVGDSVYVTLPSGYYYAGNMVLPPNTTIQGDVVMAVKAGRTGKNGSLKIKFTSAMTPQGQRIPISGKIATDDGTGILKGGTGKDRAAGIAKDAAVGAGMGALSGLVFGSLAGGKPGRGTALGTAVGGGLGLSKAVIDKGYNVEIPGNSRLDIVLDQPFAATPSADYNNNY